MQLNPKTHKPIRRKLIRSPQKCSRNSAYPEILSPHISKNFDIVLDIARTEYQNVVYNTWATQNAKMHTYLWLSAAIVSAEGALLLEIFHSKYFNPDNFFIICFAICMSFFSFCLGVDSLRGRVPTKRPISGKNYSYTVRLGEDGKYDLRLRKEIIKNLNRCIVLQLFEVNFLGKRMRCLSAMLLISSAIGALAFLSHIISQAYQG